MMQYPLAIEQFQNEPEFEKIADKEFLQLFINAINRIYEIGKRAKNSGFSFTMDLLKKWRRPYYNSDYEEKKEEKFLEIFAEYANDAYQQGVRASGKVFDIPTDTIKIYSCFISCPPNAEKMKQKEQYFAETGILQSQIILDSTGSLIDGYTSYLLAVRHGIKCVPVGYGRRQVIRASHRPDGKAYSWELPERLIDKVSAGDRVLVHTQSGVRVVTVSAVEEYAGNEPEPLRMVIRVKNTIKVEKEIISCMK